jgi:hypothetical protein
LERYRIDIGYCKECLGMQGGREQRMYRFPNGLGGSLISAPRLGKEQKWTLVALRFDGDEYETIELPNIPNGMLRDLNGSMQVLRLIMEHSHF